MSSWKSNLIEGITFLILGIILLVYNYWSTEAINMQELGGQISASLNPTFSVLLILGFFLVGVGTAQSAVTITIHKLEKTK